MTLVAADVAVVEQALQNYHHEQQRQEDTCVDGVAWLRGRVDARRSRRVGSP